MTSSVQKEPLGQEGQATSLHHSFPPSLPPSPLSLLLHLLLPHPGVKLGGQESPWKGMVCGLGVAGSKAWKSLPGYSQILPASQDYKWLIAAHCSLHTKGVGPRARNVLVSLSF